MQVQRSTFLCLIIILLLLSLMLVSCGESVGGNGKSPIFLVVGDPGGAEDVLGVLVDVYTPTVPSGVTDTRYEKFTIESIYKNQTNTPTTVFADVIITEYRVTYYRVDGSSNVPDPFMMNISMRVPAGSTGTVENLPIMLASAKLKSPLKELAFGGGEGEIYFNAVVEFFGEDLMGNAVSCKTVIIVLASDFPG
ncbi:hypothetical protein U27_04182 [Candidatus Vecturithrix granuli]|uniref:Lipoprotein n=1 Tax=Vecturithrix granuli TaxID=1499967 RepID=A0A081BY12_VECG1|nr:hypothetical protein U27_04182 [Candidatus Vecturithrix granuli]